MIVIILVEFLFNHLGKGAIDLSSKANGIDETPVIPYRETKSTSKELTFQTDTINFDFCTPALVRLFSIRFTQLIPGNYRIFLFDDTQEMNRLYQAINSVKYRYGPQFLRQAKVVIKTM